mgnify:CR=1 FL=1
MNYLGHLYLSGKDEEIITGNFIADHVKGKMFDKYSEGIREGILLHREIDIYTDSHPAFLQSKNRLADTYRKYAGVIIDMYYDHFLSRYWDDYHAEDIDRFTNRMYAIVLKRIDLLPARAKRLLSYMARDNWLKGYGSFEGLGRALSGMARRTPFESGMEKAVDDLKRNYPRFYEEFSEFFSDIIRFCKEKGFGPGTLSF